MLARRAARPDGRTATRRPAKMPDSPLPSPMNPQVEALRAKLRQIDDYRSKGLLRAEEGEAQRAAGMKQLMELLVPETPAPKLPLRVRAWGAAAMLLLVGGFTAYLISGHAGLPARSEL